MLNNEDELLDTDHNIVIAKILSNNTLDKRTEAVNRRLGNKRRIFNFDLMNDQLWEEFQKDIAKFFLGQICTGLQYGNLCKSADMLLWGKEKVLSNLHNSPKVQKFAQKIYNKSVKIFNSILYWYIFI